MKDLMDEIKKITAVYVAVNGLPIDKPLQTILENMTEEEIEHNQLILQQAREELK